MGFKMNTKKEGERRCVNLQHSEPIPKHRPNWVHADNDMHVSSDPLVEAAVYVHLIWWNVVLCALGPPNLGDVLPFQQTRYLKQHTH